MKCDQCDYMFVNGIFCHEIGCPNQNKTYDKDSDEWLKVYTCVICGYEFTENQTCCEAEDGLMDYLENE